MQARRFGQHAGQTHGPRSIRARGRTLAVAGVAGGQQAGADTYISGPSARDYIDGAMFREAGIDLQYFDYAGYLPYPQLHGAFEHHVSIVDLLCHLGPEAPRYLSRT